MPRAAAGLVAAWVALAVFVLPFWLGPGWPVVSTSWAYGYSNPAATLLVLLTLGGLALVVRPAPAMAVPPGGGPAPLVVAGGITLHVVAVSLASMLTGADGSFAEATYFVQRAIRVLGGERPWRDFDFNYGPLLLWPVVWTSQLLGGLGVVPKGAYFACLAVLNGLGLWGLAAAIRALGIRRHADAAFLVVAVLTVPLLMGLNASLTRFVAPMLAVLLLARAAALPRCRPFLGGVAVLGVAGGALVSPEAGLVAAAGVLAWLATQARAAPMAWGAALLVAASGLLVLKLLWAGRLGTAMDYASGGYNLPLVPGPVAVMYLGALLVLVPPLLAGALREGGAAHALPAAFAVLAVAQAPAARGRADPGHMLFNGLALLLLAARALEGAAPARTRMATLALLLVFGLGRLAGDALVFGNSAGKHVVDRLLPALGPEGVMRLALRFVPEGAAAQLAQRIADRAEGHDLGFLDALPRLAALKPDGPLHDHLVARPDRVRLRFEDLTGISTPAHAAELLADLRARRPGAIVVPAEDYPLRESAVFAAVYDLPALSTLLLAPTGWLRPARDALVVVDPLDAWLAANYHPAARHGRYLVLLPGPQVQALR